MADLESRFKGKIALVTGAGRGIGKAIAVRFAREGSDMVVNDIDIEHARVVADEISSLGCRALAVKADVSRSTEVEEMREDVEKAYGPRLDILVNNAGIAKILPFTETTEEIWDRIIGVNLKGAFLCCKAFVPWMMEQGHGKIINMSSKSGKVGNSWFAAYCASKFAVIGLTQSLALDLAPHGIHVNAVCPGIVFTPAWDELEKEYARKRGLAVEQAREYLVGKIPLGRPQTPEDVASTAAFLASDESSYMTGQAINVTGGQEMR